MAKKKTKSKKTKNNAKTISPTSIISKQIPIKETIGNDAIAAALSAINTSVLLKVCRLCEAKDGPFLNIFDADRTTAKRIDEVMPFKILENDDLPHKICFRCSAKLEELYEFVQKCIKTQENLRQAVGKKGPITTKVKTRHIWEEQLNKSNITNDDICDALIKKAMEGIANIPFTPVEDIKKTVNTKIGTNNNPSKKEGTRDKNISKGNNCSPDIQEDDLPLKSESEISKLMKLDLSKLPTQSRPTRSKPNIESTIEEIKIKDSPVEPQKQASDEPKRNTQIDSKESIKLVTESVEEKSLVNKPKFDITDHVSMIKVNGVGVLYQCKLCNRNFLKKEVVMSHGCAKNAGVKVDVIKTPPPQEPPKKSIVKYITTKTEPELRKPILLSDSPILVEDDEDDKPLIVKKPKPKIGPASKVKKKEDTPPPQPPPPQLLPSTPLIQQQQQAFQSYAQVNNAAISSQPTSLPAGQPPVVQFPSIPSLNSRYKLVPGPNNTFSLVEESPSTTESSQLKSTSQIRPPDPEPKTIEQPKGSTKKGLKRSASKSSNDETKLPETSKSQPYPVGLFQTLPLNSSTVDPAANIFQTPATKKQSYTVVQTGNPSKLLISTKQLTQAEEVSKKKAKKSRNESPKQPFSVTLEDTAPPKDPGFFTFINVDPLLQPSYVLPTKNIIQESQISTSTNVVKQNEIKMQNKDVDSKYTCNMCNQKFSREKKLLAHIQVHYNKLDEEDLSRSSGLGVSKRRGKSK